MGAIREECRKIFIVRRICNYKDGIGGGEGREKFRVII